MDHCHRRHQTARYCSHCLTTNHRRRLLAGYLCCSPISHCLPSIDHCCRSPTGVRPWPLSLSAPLIIVAIHREPPTAVTTASDRRPPPLTTSHRLRLQVVNSNKKEVPEERITIQQETTSTAGSK